MFLKISRQTSAQTLGESAQRVGMYLTMSRAAFREGYPELACITKQAAFEEADDRHALQKCW